MQGVDWGAELLNSAIIVVTFLLLMAYLNAVVFRPILRLLEEREKRTHGALEEARALEAEAARALAAYEEKISAARDLAAVDRALARKATLDREREILEAARAEAAARVAQIEREVAAAAERARAGLAAQAGDFARVIAEKVLGRSVGVGAVLLGLFVAGAPADAHAAAAGGEGFFANPLGGFLAHLINFAILLFILVKYAGPYLRDYLATRRATLERTLTEAAALKADAKARAREYEARLALVEAETARIREEYRVDGEVERARILAEAERAAERLRRQAETTVEQELAKARAALREEAARLATELAEQMLRRELTPADQSRLVQEFVVRLPAAGGNGRRG